MNINAKASLHPLNEARSAPQTSQVLGILLCVAVLLNGCLSRPSLIKESFAFSLPPPAVVLTTDGNGRVLGIHRLAIAPPFDSQSLIYRTGEFSYERDPYAQFLAPPAESLLAPVRGYLRGTGAFSAVAEPGSALQPNLLAEIYISELYGDFHEPTGASAVMGLHFIFFDAPEGMPGQVWLQRDYVRHIPLKGRTAAALMAGWHQALRQILAHAAADLEATQRQLQSPQSSMPQMRPEIHPHE